MDIIKYYGAAFISFLQNSSLSRYAYPLHRYLYFNTPVFALTIIIPIVFTIQGTAWGKNKTVFSPVAAFQLTCALIWSLRGNIFKQWLLGEDRPYWWVKEDSYFDDKKAPSILHYPNTCMSSPASPFYPIVATVTAILLAYHVTRFVRDVDFGQGFEDKKKWITKAVWCAAIFNICETGIADSFFASHFPHQIFVGEIIGLVAALFVLHVDFSQHSTLKKAVVTNLFFLGFTILTLYFRDATVFNEYQKKAFKWCLKREWMQMENVPFLDSFILAGYIIGTVAATSTTYFKKLNKSKFTPKMVFSLLIINLAAPQFISMVADAVPKVPTTPHVYGWYVSQMLASATMPLAIVGLIPYMVQTLSSVKPATVKAKKLN